MRKDKVGISFWSLCSKPLTSLEATFSRALNDTFRRGSCALLDYCLEYRQHFLIKSVIHDPQISQTSTSILMTILHTTEMFIGLLVSVLQNGKELHCTLEQLIHIALMFVDRRAPSTFLPILVICLINTKKYSPIILNHFNQQSQRPFQAVFNYLAKRLGLTGMQQSIGKIQRSSQLLITSRSVTPPTSNSPSRHLVSADEPDFINSISQFACSHCPSILEEGIDNLIRVLARQNRKNLRRANSNIPLNTLVERLNLLLLVLDFIRKA